MIDDKLKKGNFGRILLADDEDTFLKATAELIRKENYSCDCANTGKEAIEKMAAEDYDVLVADIKMPGNTNLEMIREIARIRPGIEMILITGYPTQQSAIDAIHMPVSVYMIKPIDFDELLNNISKAMKNRILHRTVVQTKQNLTQWLAEIQRIEGSLAGANPEIFKTALKSYLEITTARINTTFSEIRRITGIFDTFNNTPVCNMMQCPNLNELSDAIRQAIESIKTTKDAHRSKQLGQLRTKLEKLEKNITKI
ncbi:MAG: response regulator [Anaerohalosphaeraceae bacterium]|nr:response regulator [Anaerohalosphaeraceae bacterium]